MENLDGQYVIPQTKANENEDWRLKQRLIRCFEDSIQNSFGQEIYPLQHVDENEPFRFIYSFHALATINVKKLASS